APPITMRVTREYDEFGDVTVERNLGDVARSGDERFTESEYVHDAARWIVKSPARVTVKDTDGNRVSETLSYYDGEPYVGLPSGQVTRGNLARDAAWVSGSAYVDRDRKSYDPFGNPIGSLDALGSSDDPTLGHARAVAFDPLLRTYPIRETVYVG